MGAAARVAPRATAAAVSRRLLAAIEGGGTKFVCAVGYSADETVSEVVLATREAASTLAAVFDYFGEEQRRLGKIHAMGIGSFGPLDLRKGSRTYGRILPTPKPGWSGADLLSALRSRFEIPMALDTDVTAAALGELTLGAGRDVDSLAYITVGTGIGGGFAPAVPGTRLLHPEMGHLRVMRDERDTEFVGICPFHGDCLEGLASGPAICARWGKRLDELCATHPAYPIVGNYLGQLATAVALVGSPQRIIFGGGVLTSAALLPHIRQTVRRLLNGYLEPLNDDGALERYIGNPGLGNRAGLAGAFLLAAQAYLQ